jgi:hypothetical protein
MPLQGCLPEIFDVRFRFLLWILCVDPFLSPHLPQTFPAIQTHVQNIENTWHVKSSALNSTISPIYPPDPQRQSLQPVFRLRAKGQHREAT